MIRALVDYALNNRLMVVVAAILLLVWGVISFHNLPVEAYPDVANNYVQVITQWPGRAAEEVEQQVTIPIEIVMNGIPHLDHLRSTSLFGLSSVMLIFDDQSDNDWNRQKALERMSTATLPNGVQPQIGTDYSPVGQIYWYTLKSTNPQYDLMELKSLEDWVLEKQFKSVPNVVDVVSFGGITKEYQVRIDPDKLVSYGLSIGQVEQQLANNNVNAGGSFVEAGLQQINVRAIGQVKSVRDIEDTVVKTQAGTPLRIKDIGTVAQGARIRLGQIGKAIHRADGKILDNGDVIEGIVLLRKGANSDSTIDAIHDKVQELNEGIADEMRLWHAIERQYLVPFDFYGVYDGTDLSALSWSRGSYAIGELEERYLGNTRRANLVLSQFREVYGEWRQARALGFCVSIAHAQFMAQIFRESGVPAAAITSDSPAEERVSAASMLRNREVNVLFTVDLFNEGVDIPEIDCVLFLRPTESSTVFLQQLGRGLRLDTGKTSCLVLDFIGNQRREFRFDQRFSVLLGGTRQQVIGEIETGITRLPGNCYFRLDKESRRVILENLKAQLNANRPRMVAELRVLALQLRRRPSLSEYLSETRYELTDIYKASIGGWHALLDEAQLLAPGSTPADRLLAGRFHFLLHIDSTRRLRLNLNLLGEADRSLDDLPGLDKRMIEMLTFRLLQKEARQPECAWSEGLQRLRMSASAREELKELSEVLLDRVRLHSEEVPALDGCPLFLHRQYMRDEVLVGLGMPDQVGARHTQTGRFWIETVNTEIFFVTLDKSEKAFSPSTRYEDFAVSPSRFHWQSQSTTGEDSPTGHRYVFQKQNGFRFLLFVRPKRGDPFVFLGPLHYVSHIGSRPMSIYWDLEHPMPAWFFEICASLRAA